MAEEQQKGDFHAPPSMRHHPGPDDVSEEHSQPSETSLLSKEKLHQQRQKCELRRLLKHTHPELKKLDDVVDEELAEVLSGETCVTTGETGYEGEVLSRRLIFENCAWSEKVSPYAPKRHMAKGSVARRDNSAASAVSEEHDGRMSGQSVKGIAEDGKMLGYSPHTEGEEETMSVDVKATRRIFENDLRLNEDKLQEKVTSSGEETKQEVIQIAAQIADHEFAGMEEVCSGETVSEDKASFPDPETSGGKIETRAALFKNNPFISTNIDSEHYFVESHSAAGDGGQAQDHLMTNVKDRAHLFESLPFDKIKHQNKDEVETMVENIKETLSSLYRSHAIHSAGSIIEVNETMIAKKAKFTLTEGGPEIKYDEVAEGGAQNFILQLLPRTNLKPQIIYLKEDVNGRMATTTVNVHVHQHQFSASHDTEFKTANVVQVVEDILNQDNSLRKGVIIQEDVDSHAEVVVYALYNYSDEEDVKWYSPPLRPQHDEPEPERRNMNKTDNQGLQKGEMESTTSCHLQAPDNQTCTRPEITVKGHVQLFRSCIEKGDLEYLKSFQTEPTVQEQKLPVNQDVAGQGKEIHYEERGDQTEGTTEWVPVDVKKLKNIFSGDQRPVQPKQKRWENLAKSTSISDAFSGQNVPLGRNLPPDECSVGVLSQEQLKNTLTACSSQTKTDVCNSPAAPQRTCLHPETQNDDQIHKAELVEAVDDNDEIANLQTAIETLKQATLRAKSQEMQKIRVQESIKEPVYVKDSRTETKLARQDEDGQEDQSTKPRWDELPSATDIPSEHKLDRQQEDREASHKTTDSEEVGTTEICSKATQNSTEMVQKSVSAQSSETNAAQQENEEVVFHGKLQTALNSLEKSNINVTRGDFRAAMIYRNASKSHKQTYQSTDGSVRDPTREGLCPFAEPESAQAKQRQEVSEAKADPQSDTNKAAEKERRPTAPKPAIPPKPEHLKVKQRDIQSTNNTRNPDVNHSNHVKPKENVYSKESPGPDSGDCRRNELSKTEVRHEIQSSVITVGPDNTDNKVKAQQLDINVTTDEKSTEDFSEKGYVSDAKKNFQEESRETGPKKLLSVKSAPVKPKRVKIAQPDNNTPKHMSSDSHSPVLTQVVEEQQQILTGPSCNNTNPSENTGREDKPEGAMKQESKVEMRGKRGRTETEDERRQRLSVHMDEIMKGNITAAMEIFDNLRKQEELQSILSRVEEIEKDTSDVDVRSLRGVFENVPDWVVSSNKKKQKHVKEEEKEERMLFVRDTSENKSSMAHVFGDLERASEEIMNLKEQTLARLMDIEGAIKKALYSVSTLKSDSDIAGLSSLFKESLGTVQGSPSSANISKISIGSSRTKPVPTQEGPSTQETTAQPGSRSANTEAGFAKQRASPPSSPAFISIQSAAKQMKKSERLPTGTKVCPTCQHSPKTGEKFRTTKTLTCNSPAQNRKGDPRKGGQKQPICNQLGPHRELSVLEVQTDSGGHSIRGTKTVTENYERTDNLGNRFYSSKTSTVVTTQPETTAPIVSPATYQVTKYPEVRLPINQKP